MAGLDQIDNELRDRVDEFVAELSDLIRAAALEAVREALGSELGTVRATAPRSTKRRATKKRSAKKRSSKASRRTKRASKKRGRQSDADLEKVMGLVTKALAKEANLGVEQLAGALKIDSARVKQPVAMLLEAGTIKRKGKARGTKYSLA